MEMKMNTRKDLINKFSKEYQKADKKQKAKILDNFIEATGYNRSYSAYLLRNNNKLITKWVNGSKIIYKVGLFKKKKSRRRKYYDDEFLKSLIYLWNLSYYSCGKRLKSSIPLILLSLKNYNEISITKEIEKKILKVSPATIDRLLLNERNKLKIKNKGTTKHGPLLKDKISIRTFADWEENEPGFVEIDLVAHSGGHSRGDFCYTLDVTDVYTGWTETKAIKNKAQIWVFEALKDIKASYPFKIKGIDSDNGSEFINDQLIRYCEKEHITFTRARAYRKNDKCYVEQKNNSIVRKYVGYFRYDTKKELELLNHLYQLLRDYTNFFHPIMKTKEKERIGAKVFRKYDIPETPYQRCLKNKDISKEIKISLNENFKSLNIKKLLEEIVFIQNKLIKIQNEKKMEMTKLQKNNLNYNKFCVNISSRN